jgi:hypothetical protein
MLIVLVCFVLVYKSQLSSEEYFINHIVSQIEQIENSNKMTNKDIGEICDNLKNSFQLLEKIHNLTETQQIYYDIVNTSDNCVRAIKTELYITGKHADVIKESGNNVIKESGNNVTIVEAPKNSEKYSVLQNIWSFITNSTVLPILTLLIGGIITLCVVCCCNKEEKTKFGILEDCMTPELKEKYQ